MSLASSRPAIGRVAPWGLAPPGGSCRAARPKGDSRLSSSVPHVPFRGLACGGWNRPSTTARFPTAGRAPLSLGVSSLHTSAFAGSDPDAEVPLSYLLETAKAAAQAGASAVRAAADAPRRVRTKSGFSDLVTDTDALSERLVIECIGRRLPAHHVLGEEGGVVPAATALDEMHASGSDDAAPFFPAAPLSDESASLSSASASLSDDSTPSSSSSSSASAPVSLGRYLWCVDPLDGTTNFAHGYPSFAVSVAVLDRGFPVAACVVEFHGGPGAWAERIYEASLGGGAFCDGQAISVSHTAAVRDALLVTGFGYLHDAAWAANLGHFATLTARSHGVRREGAAAVDLSHVALGVADAFWEPRLKPWDIAAGMLIVKEAGGFVTSMERIQRGRNEGKGAEKESLDEPTVPTAAAKSADALAAAPAIPGPRYGAFEPTLLVASTQELCAELLEVIGTTTTDLIDNEQVQGLRGAHYLPEGYVIEQGVW